MSENLDLVRSIYADRERGDFSSAEWAHPEIEYVLADGPDPGSWRGVAAMSEGWRNILAVWDDLTATAEEYRDSMTAACSSSTAEVDKRKTSGFEIDEVRTKGATLWHVRDGTVARLRVSWDRDRALADLGLKA
jgi:ketosteroid isomerase-like protein